MSTTQNIIAKPWNLSNHLPDDGVTDHQYVSELGFLHSLKMVTETQEQLPKGQEYLLLSWQAL
jgi:hypothetical protein